MQTDMPATNEVHKHVRCAARIPYSVPPYGAEMYFSRLWLTITHGSQGAKCSKCTSTTHPPPQQCKLASHKMCVHCAPLLAYYFTEPKNWSHKSATWRHCEVSLESSYVTTLCKPRQVTSIPNFLPRTSQEDSLFGHLKQYHVYTVAQQLCSSCDSIHSLSASQQTVWMCLWSRLRSSSTKKGMVLEIPCLTCSLLERP